MLLWFISKYAKIWNRSLCFFFLHFNVLYYFRFGDWFNRQPVNHKFWLYCLCHFCFRVFTHVLCFCICLFRSGHAVFELFVLVIGESFYIGWPKKESTATAYFFGPPCRCLCVFLSLFHMLCLYICSHQSIFTAIFKPVVHCVYKRCQFSHRTEHFQL